MIRTSSDTDSNELQEIRLPRALLQEVAASAQAAGRSLEDHLVQICRTGLAVEAMLPSGAAGLRPQDLMSGLVAVLKDPKGSPALREVLRRNPVRTSVDPHNPQRAWMTCADGSVVQGRLMDGGEFVVDESD